MLVSNVKEKALQDEVQLETYRCELKRLMEWVRAHGTPEIRSKQRCDDQTTRSFDPWASKDQGQEAFIVKQPALLCNLVLLKPYTLLYCWYEFTSTSNWNCPIRPKAHPRILFLRRIQTLYSFTLRSPLVPRPQLAPTVKDEGVSVSGCCCLQNWPPLRQ